MIVYVVLFIGNILAIFTHTKVFASYLIHMVVKTEQLIEGHLSQLQPHTSVTVLCTCMPVCLFASTI